MVPTKYQTGTAIVLNTERITELLDATVDNYDTAYKKQWDELPEEYVEEYFSISMKISAVGGRYLSPVDITASIADGEIQFIEEEAFSLRQSAYFRSDVKLSYRKEYRKSSLEISLDLQNVTNNNNIFRQDWNARTRQVVNNYQQGFFPVPFVRFTF